MEQDSPYPVLNYFVTAGGSIDVGRIEPIDIDCGAIAFDDATVWVLLIRREGETLHELLRRLNDAVAGCFDIGQRVGEPAVVVN